MTDNDIIDAAVKKAQENGFNVDRDIKFFLDACSWEMFIFSHPFSKAFWGEELVICDNQGSEIPKWEYELMQTVRKENPIKYLEKFL